MRFKDQYLRILAINSKSLGSNVSEKHCLLVNQYLRSVARLALEKRIELRSPDFEPDAVFGCRVSIESEQMAKLRTQFSEHFYVLQIICRHLRLAKMSEISEDAAANYNLFGPLIEVFEDGGTLDKHHGEIIVNGRWTAPAKGSDARLGP